MLVSLYLGLLLAGIGCFVLHYLAYFRVARLLRRRYPQQWAIIAEPDQGRPSAFGTWIRLQRVLRSQAPHLFDDASLTRWHRTWRFSQWAAWSFWLAALLLQWSAR